MINTPSPSLQAAGNTTIPPLAASPPIVAVLSSLLSSLHPTPAAAASPIPSHDFADPAPVAANSRRILSPPPAFDNADVSFS